MPAPAYAGPKWSEDAGAVPVADAAPACLKAALAYAARGWLVVPLWGTAPDGGCECPKGKACGKGGRSAGKHPRLSEWQHKATTDAATLRRWWASWPRANVGLVAGPASGWWVLDVDVDEAKGVDGEASLAALEAEHGALPATATGRTGGGGRHLLFRWPEDREVQSTQGRPAPLAGLDVRGRKAGRPGQIVAPPSLHASGRRYRWERDGEVAAAPRWLLDLIAPPEVAPPPRPPRPVLPPSGDLTRGVRTMLDRECGKVTDAPEGGKHEALYRAAFCLGGLVGEGVLPEDRAAAELKAAAEAGGWPPGAADRTIADGLEAGASKPWAPPERAWRCSRCSAGGGALDLAAWGVLGREAKRGDGAGWAKLRARLVDLELVPASAGKRWLDGFKADVPTVARALGRTACAGADGVDVTPCPACAPGAAVAPSSRPTPPRPPEPAPPPPRPEGAAEVWAACRPVLDDPEVSTWLRSRGLDPAKVEDRDLARALPEDLDVPGWANFRGHPWTAGWRCVLPAYSSTGRLESLRARWCREGTPPTGNARDKESAAGAGAGSATGLVLADALGRELLRTGARPSWWPEVEPLRVVVAEGAPDFLTWAVRWSEAALYAPAVLGLWAGSWTPEVAARVPDGARVTVWTDDNAAGDRYAETVRSTLAGRCVVLRPRGGDDDAT